MPRPTRLFDLFGDFTSGWPVSVVRYFTGVHAPGSSTPDPTAWLVSLDRGVRFTDVRTGVSDGRATMDAGAFLDLAPTGYLDGFPFVIDSMPDVEFRVQGVGSAAVRVYVSTADDGTEVLLEGLPVEIRLPVGLVAAHPGDGRDEGDFTAGRHDDLRIVYRDHDVTSVFVHIRLHVTASGEVTVRTVVPIGFSNCLFLGLPCLNVHDFQLLPSPSLAPTPGPDLEPLEPDGPEWLRHGIRPWIPGLTGPYDGCFAVRSVEPDPAREPLAGILRAFKGRVSLGDDPQTPENRFGRSSLRSDHPNRAIHVEEAELVLEDVVLPFFGPPLPRHLTFGLRRRTVTASDPVAETSFATAPIRIDVNAAPMLGLMVESLFYRSMPGLAEGGLSVSVSLLLGGEGPARHAVGITVEEGWKLLATYRRNFDEHQPPPALLHFEIAGNAIDVTAVRVGYALGRALTEKAGFGDCFEATVDLLVDLPASGGSEVGLKSLDGQPVRFLAERIGWRDGGFGADGFALPDGVMGHIGPFGIYLREIGILAEDGASYLTLSGGLLFAWPKGTEGGAGVERLRIRVAGPESAPRFRLGGAFVFLRTPMFALEAGGRYTDEQTGPTRRREYALTGSVQAQIFDELQRFGVDVLWGHLTGPGVDLRYWLVQIFFRGSLPIACVELRGARVLFASGMRPELTDPKPGGLRYYEWYKRTDPVTVTGDRRLAAWRPRADSWALGIGAGISFAKAGKLIELGAFVLVLSGPDERGLLVAGEVRLLGSAKAVGYFALELDMARRRYSLLAGVSLRVSTFLEAAPLWLEEMTAIEGTLFVSNEPATVAIGRLADERSWLSARLDVEIPFLAHAHFLLALCLELVEGPGGVNGFGFAFRAEVGIDAGIIRASAFVGLGLSHAVFTTGSVDHLFRAWAEAGLRIVLFGFLRFGISARVEYRHLGASPSRDELQGEVRLETPWFLPDVTWHWEYTSGTVTVSALAIAASPLRSSAARLDAGDQTFPVVLVRAGAGSSLPLSIQELRQSLAAPSDPLTGQDPLPIDATIELEWSVPVNDRLGLSRAVEPGRGDQRTGDLALSYDLVGIRIRRRPRFSADRTFRPLEEITELSVEFTGQGPRIKGSFEATALAMLWDLDVRADGRPTTKKLWINAATPFGFTVSSPENDARLIEASPGWPCGPEPSLDGHQLTFRDEPTGRDLRQPRYFKGTRSTVRFLRPAWTAMGSQDHSVGAFSTLSFTLAFRVDFDEDAAAAVLAYACSGTTFIRLYDVRGDLIGVREIAPSSSVQPVALTANGPIRRIDVWVEPPRFLPARIPARLELDTVSYAPLSAWLDFSLAPGRPGQTAGYEGKGKIAFLPNHEYEIAVTTRVTVTHPTVPAETADVVEYVYFHTKGLPGLNATGRAGEELEPYVHRLYRGGLGTLYREEPVAIVFTEGFHVAIPLASRPGGSAEEHLTVQRMHLVAPAVTTTSVTEGVRLTSKDLKRKRLAALTAASVCAPADPLQTIGTALLASPEGGLWPARASLTASVRLQDAPFVDRQLFAPGDETAFDLLSGSWSVDASGLGPDVAGGCAAFGEPGWDHMTVQVTIADAANAAGIGLSLPASGSSARGLFVLIRGDQLALYRLEPGKPDFLLGRAALTAPAPWFLEVTAFDDRVRARVGDVQIEADREEFREGRLCLAAEGPARFTSLLVTGLELYAFPFKTSRYASFAEHIESFRGDLPAVEPDLMGPGTTTSTVSALDTGRPFDHWISALGLPLEQEVTALGLTRYVEDGDTALLLLQTPEPLDFTAETKLQLVPETTAAPIPCEILQNGTGLAALIVPRTPLPAGSYALTFTLDRPRWKSTGSDYTASATLKLAW